MSIQIMDSASWIGRWVLKIAAPRLDLSAQWLLSMVCHQCHVQWLDKHDALSDAYIKLYTHTDIRDKWIYWIKRLIDDDTWLRIIGAPNYMQSHMSDIPALDDDFDFTDYIDLAIDATRNLPNTTSTAAQLSNDYVKSFNDLGFEEIWPILGRNYWLITTLIEAMTKPNGFNLWIWLIKMGTPLTDCQIDYFINREYRQGRYVSPEQATTLYKFQPFAYDSFMLLASYGAFDAFNACIDIDHEILYKNQTQTADLIHIRALNIPPHTSNMINTILSKTRISRELLGAYIYYMPITGDLSELKYMNFGPRVQLSLQTHEIADQHLSVLKKTLQDRINLANNGLVGPPTTCEINAMAADARKSLFQHILLDQFNIIVCDSALISIIGAWSASYRPVSLTSIVLTNIRKILNHVITIRGLPQLSLYSTLMAGDLFILLDQ
jgi:hypothetical protein